MPGDQEEAGGVAARAEPHAGDIPGTSQLYAVRGTGARGRAVGSAWTQLPSRGEEKGPETNSEHLRG